MTRTRKTIAVLLSGAFCALIPDGAEGAPEPRVAWAFQGGGAEHDKIRAIAVDAEGNTYLTGEFTGVAEFGPVKVEAKGGMDFVLIKLNPRGEVAWVTTAGGDLIDRGYAVAVDGGGNTYVTGHFQSPSISFGDTVLENAGDYDVFVARFDPGGKPVWARRAGGEAYDYGHGIVVTDEGITVSGAVRGKGDFGTGHGTPGDSMGPFVARYSPAGEVRWTRFLQGQGSGSGHEIAADAAGNLYLGGFFAGKGRLGSCELDASGARDLFAAKLDRDGNCLWVTQGGGASDGLVSDIAPSADGSACYLAGMFKATVRFGDASHTSAGNHDIYLAKLDSGGGALWSVHAGGPDIDYGLGLDVDESGAPLLTGETTGNVSLLDHEFRAMGRRDLYAARFSPDGSLRWAWQAGGTLAGLSYAAACGPDGTAVIAGAFSGEIGIGGATLASRGSNDIIVVGLVAP